MREIRPDDELSWPDPITRELRRARWLSADDRRPPDEIVVVDDALGADRAIELAESRRGLLWSGDYVNGCRLLDAMKRRLARTRAGRALPPAQEFRRQRQHRGRMSRVLGAVIVPLAPAPTRVPLRRAPRIDHAVDEVFGPVTGSAVLPLRELLGITNAHRQRHAGIAVGALGDQRIHPHFGVFAPTRQDYLQLVARQTAARMPIRPVELAFDIGTGTGVLSAILVRAGASRVVATDTSARAVACARDNIARLGLAEHVDVQHRDLFPPGRADLVVANPPWVPGSPHSDLDRGVFDPAGQVLERLVRGVGQHLRAGGEAWLILSDLAEHLGLRHPDHVPALIEAGGLVVRDRRSMRSSTRRRALGADDPLAELRSREQVHLWRMTGA
jgi:SAM-dependent methyltransferase